MFATSSGSWNVIEKYKQCMFYIGCVYQSQTADALRTRVLDYSAKMCSIADIERNTSCSCTKSKTTLLSMLNWSCLLVDCIETILLWCWMRLRVWNYESHYKICYRKLERRGVLPWSCWPRPANSPSRSNARWPPCLGRWWPMLHRRASRDCARL